jgi:hypothetical protein
MAGNWIFNLLLGLFGFFIVFLLSFTGNSLLTTFVRAFSTFISFFLIGYIFRWMFAYIKADKRENAKISDSQASVNKNIEMEQLISGLSDEEAKQVAQYIRAILNDERKQ